MDTAALHCLQSGQQEAVTQEEGEAEGARLRGEAAKPIWLAAASTRSSSRVPSPGVDDPRSRRAG